MQRAIKFRGQRIDTKEWISGWLAPSLGNDTMCIMPESYFATRDFGESEDDDKPILQDGLALGEFFIVDPSTIGQFTGLHDTGKKEIYEGDIIIAANGDKHTILFGEWRYPSHIDTDDLVDHGIGFNIGGIEPFGECVEGGGSMYQIIGNIYENQELIR